MKDQRAHWPSWLRHDPQAHKFRCLDAEGVYEQVERKAIKAANLEEDDDV